MTQNFLGSNRGRSLAMNPGALDLLTATPVAASTTNISALTSTSIQALNSPVTLQFTTTGIAALTSTQLSSLSMTQIAVTATTLASLSTTAITALGATTYVPGLSGTGDDMEMRWDSTKGLTRLDLRQFTEQVEFAIENPLLTQTAIPAT
jgi:hypothetical protein